MVEQGRPHESDWAAAFDQMTSQWADLESSPIDYTDWASQFKRMSAQQAALDTAGLWRSAPADLLTICGVHHRETAHSSALAWLCSDSETHGLGALFLRELLALAGEADHPTGPFEVGTEVVRANSRADLVAESMDVTLILEIKLDANESPRQCQRLYEDWHGTPGLRLLFVTPTGRAPVTTTSLAAAAAWRTAPWRRVLQALDRAVTISERPPTDVVAQYRQTLHRLYGRRSG
ncbi:PD-(D/E)XK nuclease family protein [Dactylosporangium sp. CA-139114]|uniref:PD-(D/E)XK nuclease family protein n=1 Tax=Dactylosporangium sp. CA-139114 TaxID=3239931 RepID=UPI003D973A76